MSKRIRPMTVPPRGSNGTMVPKLPDMYVPSKKEVAQFKATMKKLFKGLEEMKTILKPFNQMARDYDKAQEYQSRVSDRLSDDEWKRLDDHVERLSRTFDDIDGSVQRSLDKLLKTTDTLVENSGRY